MQRLGTCAAMECTIDIQWIKRLSFNQQRELLWILAYTCKVANNFQISNRAKPTPTIPAITPRMIASMSGSAGQTEMNGEITSMLQKYNNNEE